MKRECTEAENSLIWQNRDSIITDSDWLFIRPNDKFWVNGGTVLEYKRHYKEGASLIFVEDDLRDKLHRPCCVECAVFSNLDIQPGERIILLYNKDGAYMQMRVTEHTKDMISMEPPEYFKQMNWKTAQKLPHPAVPELDRKSRLMEEAEKKALCKKICTSKRFRKRNWTGVVLSSFCMWFFLFLVLMELVYYDIVVKASTANVVIAMMLLIWGGFTYLIYKVAFTGRMQKLHKLRYQKKVMFLSVGDSYMIKEDIRDMIYVYEYVHGSIRVRAYPIIENLFLPREVCCGSIIYKYSQEADNKEEEPVYFSVPDIR